MRVPEALVPLVDMGVVDEVLRPLMAGKEAQVFLVRVGDELRVAKVYKEANHRSFKHRSAYAEGRGVRNTRSQRAMAKRSRYGRAEEEAAWRSAEVDAIHRLAAWDVAVPTPYDFVEGVFVMSLVADENGEPAPRLVDVDLTRGEATRLFERLVREVVKMLCAGLIHGDLSDFNVLIGVDGPVIIDFPQAVDAAANNNARRLLVRDVRNLQSFLSRFAPELRRKQYGEEMWALYERGQLQPDTRLTGRFQRTGGATDVESILREITAAEREARARRRAEGYDDPEPAPPPRPPRQRQKPAPRKKEADLFDDLDALLSTDPPSRKR
jgi:RIO kinase 1